LSIDLDDFFILDMLSTLRLPKHGLLTGSTVSRSALFYLFELTCILYGGNDLAVFAFCPYSVRSHLSLNLTTTAVGIQNIDCGDFDFFLQG